MMGHIFPWKSGNRFDLLIDGPSFFPAMLADIDRAEHHVSLELYLVEDGRCSEALVEVLCQAARRGVKVRCLFDGFGSQKLGQALRGRLAEAGVLLQFYNPIRWRRGANNFYRDHRKILVVDDRVAYVGGTGSTDDFWQPGEAESHWHEAMVAIHGPLVVHWKLIFDFQWLANLSRRPWLPEEAPGLRHLPPYPSAGVGMGRVAYADARQHLDIVQSLVRSLRNAKERVWLATPYFLPSWKVRRALIKAARRGVDVRLLLTGRNTDHPPVRFAGQRYYPRLLRANVRIFEYQPRFLHLKMVLVDGWVSVGSCNFDHWNLRFNLEANVEALDRHFTEQVAASLGRDFDDSREITLEDWHARPLLKRFYQRLWGWLDRLAVNLLDRRR
ncbi:phosphatidylserine/phosphatidylglycerophosphate/cardiolipin synthase family protein [Pseudomonas otitidis]|uniref:phospholipase D-like domain-containing protein n=1 Tax=Metapseudomonas otitidis TaxID=319939 RepID=UPI00244B3C95|nr:phosphatidylserine/phosphatidylglycerophosphate/cardiolipin synthase family protein [Pseudomonas otitidis]MDH1110095.1 phosphatidylserine/phosphatidylglycerophosphate/cardiolipin synthase family protein [Pseudomonas otitidis]MDH1162062.1 phosphatidylserine/phosphatidylglycerophosphate/cardiolipin synthase family protein [Pseudomonas otitidis]MDH1167853.1 phosphatidylserine/phosphatidylglycerophosphate/cardiolipin synthase family protein [Pseudomonas otitidis]